MKNHGPADAGLSPYQPTCEPGVSWEVAEGVNRLVGFFFVFLVFLLLISMLEKHKIKGVSLFSLRLDLCRDLMNVFLFLFSQENIVFCSEGRVKVVVFAPYHQILIH